MFGFSKKQEVKTSKMEQTVATATALGLLKELNDCLLEEKEAKNLLSMEKEKHELFREMKQIQDRRDDHMRSIRKVWEEATKNGYSPTKLWESKQQYEEDRLNLASEYDDYYGYKKPKQ